MNDAVGKNIGRSSEEERLRDEFTEVGREGLAVSATPEDMDSMPTAMWSHQRVHTGEGLITFWF